MVLAYVLMEAGRLDEALQEACAVVKVAPADGSAHSTLGAVYLKMSDGARALAAFDRMAELLDPAGGPHRSSGWVACNVGRGAGLSLLGRHDEAVTAFEEALRTTPDFFERWPELARYYQFSSQAIGQNSRRH